MSLRIEWVEEIFGEKIGREGIDVVVARVMGKLNQQWDGIIPESLVKDRDAVLPLNTSQTVNAPVEPVGDSTRNSHAISHENQSNTNQWSTSYTNLIKMNHTLQSWLHDHLNYAPPQIDLLALCRDNNIQELELFMTMLVTVGIHMNPNLIEKIENMAAGKDILTSIESLRAKSNAVPASGAEKKDDDYDRIRIENDKFKKGLLSLAEKWKDLDESLVGGEFDDTSLSGIGTDPVDSMESYVRPFSLNLAASSGVKSQETTEEVKEIADKLQSANANISKLEESLSYYKSLSESLEKYKSQYESEVEKNTTLTSQLEELSASKALVGYYKEEVRKLHQSNATLQADLVNLRIEQSFKNPKDIKNKDIPEEQTVPDIQDKRLENRISELEKRLEESLALNEEYHYRYSQLQTQHSSLKNQMEEQTIKFSSQPTPSKQSSLRRQTLDSATSASDHPRIERQLYIKCENLESEVEILQTKLSQSKHRITELEQTIIGLKETLNLLENFNPTDESTKALLKATQTISNYSTQNGSLRAALKQARNLIVTLELRLRELQKTKNEREWKEELEFKDRVIERLKSEVEDVRRSGKREVELVKSAWYHLGSRQFMHLAGSFEGTFDKSVDKAVDGSGIGGK